MTEPINPFDDWQGAATPNIRLEGPLGCGKLGLMFLLRDALRAAGVNVVVDNFEPGDFDVSPEAQAERVRRLCRNSQINPIHILEP